MSCNSNRFKNNHYDGRYPEDYPYEAERFSAYGHEPYNGFREPYYGQYAPYTPYYPYAPYRNGSCCEDNGLLFENPFIEPYRYRRCFRRALRCCDRRY